MLATLLLYAAALFAGANSARLHGALTVTDAFLFLAGLILLPSVLLRRTLAGVNPLFLAGGALLVSGAILGATSKSEYSANLAPVAKLVIAVFFVYAVFLAWRPSVREAWRFSWCFIASACASSIWGLLHQNPYTHRAQGFMVHPNHLALVALLALGPAVSAAVVVGGRKAIVAAIAAGFLVVGEATSGSRAGLVGVAAIVVLAAGLVARRRAARLTLFAALAVAVAVPLFLVVSPSENAFARALSSSGSAQQSDTERRQLITQAVKLVEDHPISGAGFEAAKQPHDIFLGVLSGGGPLALLGMLLIVAMPFRALINSSRIRDSAPRDYALISGLSLGACGFFVACLFQNTIWDRYLWLPLSLLAFLAIVMPIREGGGASWA